MVSSHSIKIFFITMIVTFLVSLVEPAADCSPSFNAKSDEKKQKFIIMFDDKVKNAAESHYQMLQDCYNVRVEHVRDQNLFSANSEKFLDFSVGSLQGYTARITPSFAEQLKKMNGITLVEKDREGKLQYAIPQTLTRRVVDNKPTKNDDRIDQAKRPLDGKYISPDSAGKNVNIFIFDSGIL